MQVTNIHKNNVGTISFDAKFSGMRKPQDFVVYPINERRPGILIQSDNRLGYVMTDGQCVIVKAKNVAEFGHRPKIIDKIDNINELLAAIRSTDSTINVRDGYVITVADNSGAAKI